MPIDIAEGYYSVYYADVNVTEVTFALTHLCDLHSRPTARLRCFLQTVNETSGLPITLSASASHSATLTRTSTFGSSPTTMPSSSATSTCSFGSIPVVHNDDDGPHTTCIDGRLVLQSEAYASVYTGASAAPLHTGSSTRSSIRSGGAASSTLAWAGSRPAFAAAPAPPAKEEGLSQDLSSLPLRGSHSIPLVVPFTAPLTVSGIPALEARRPLPHLRSGPSLGNSSGGGGGGNFSNTSASGGAVTEWSIETTEGQTRNGPLEMMWVAVYWITFLLTYVVVPVVQEYVVAGEAEEEEEEEKEVGQRNVERARYFSGD